MFYQKFFLNALLCFLLIQIVFHYTASEAVKYLLYSIELGLIFFSLILAVQKVNKFTKKFSYLLLFILLFCFNWVLNDQSNLDDFFKLFGGIAIFLAAYYVGNQEISTRHTKTKVITIALLPLVIFAIDTVIGFQESSNSMSIFSNSNNYIFYSICCVWLMMLYKIPKKFIWLFLILSFAITSTLGAFLGFILAVIFYFRKRLFHLEYLFGFLLLSSAVAYLIAYSELYLFDRLRGSADVFFTLLNNYSIKEFSEVSFGKAMAMSGSNDGSDVSFLFRIKLWTESLVYFFNQKILYLLFGLGLGSIPSINSFGLVAHNDYLTWFIEMGILGFCLIVFGIWYGFFQLKDTKYGIPYLAVLIYFFSENLFYNFFAIILFGFCLAVSIQKINYENITNK